MAKTKTVTPYQRLLEDARDFARKVKYRHRTTMWLYDKAKLGTGWSLVDLYERTAAAEQLGYDVVLEANENGLLVKYVKKVPETPWEFKA
jgi:hypothetical protein